MNNIRVICPLLLGGKFNESEVLGSAVWLWVQSPAHNGIPLYMLPTMLLPAIKKQQFALGVEDNKAVFFISWARMNEASEKTYLTAKSSAALQENDWDSGNRLWFIDWVAPFNHNAIAVKVIRHDLFAHSCGRSLYHKSDKIGTKVRLFRGKQVSAQAGKTWEASHPLALTIR